MDEPTHFESLYPPDSRFEEVDRILHFIKEGNSCQVLGLPGAGRSNLLGLFSYNRAVRLKHLGENQKWFHFVLCNFSEIRKKPFFEAEKFIFLSLVDSLRERQMADLYLKANEIFKESIGLNDELVLFNGLKKTLDLLAIEKELTIVFLFDRFEEYVPMITNEFFANLRVLRNRAKYRFSVVLSLNRPLEDLVEPFLFADFYEFIAGHNIFLSLIDKPGLDFRISYLEKITGKKIEPGLKNKVVELTAGHGKLMRLCLEAVQDVNKDLRAKNKELVSYLLEQKPVVSSLNEIWQFLTPSEQKLITHNLELITPQSFLETIGLVKTGQLTIPLFTEFLKSNIAIQQYSNITITFDSNTNEIKKGDLILSNQLTASEFRLLKFLIENPEKIMDREEIIQNVWKNTQTTAGVTDQALDQLIFRLRRKIEDDPNNPTHLQTIKGRGLKFSP